MNELAKAQDTQRTEFARNEALVKEFENASCEPVIFAREPLPSPWLCLCPLDPVVLLAQAQGPGSVRPCRSCPGLCCLRHTHCPAQAPRLPSDDLAPPVLDPPVL